MNTNEQILIHHGIKGMKWGIRRYQNPDGTLTAEGRKKYGVETVRETKRLSYSQDLERLKYKKGTEGLNEKENKKLRTLENGKKFYEMNNGIKLTDLFSKEGRAASKWYSSTNYSKEKNTRQFMGQMIAGIPGNLIAGGIYGAMNYKEFVKEIREDNKRG